MVPPPTSWPMATGHQVEDRHCRIAWTRTTKDEGCHPRGNRRMKQCAAWRPGRSSRGRPLADQNGHPALAEPRPRGEGARARDAALRHRVLGVAVQDHDVAALEPQLHLAAAVWPRGAVRSEPGTEDEQQGALGLRVAVAAHHGAVVVNDDLGIVPATTPGLQQLHTRAELRQLLQQPVCYRIKILHAQARAPRMLRAPPPEHLNDHGLALPALVGLGSLHTGSLQVSECKLLEDLAPLPINIASNKKRLISGTIGFDAKTLLAAKRGLREHECRQRTARRRPCFWRRALSQLAP
mmetsp:Transcript_7107/g.21641  ORF Transcript_7107/g.21641 Transcript_7107/m.21641 type:complete len:295 (-) Transcript_7107:143-1027(-)